MSTAPPGPPAHWTVSAPMTAPRPPGQDEEQRSGVLPGKPAVPGAARAARHGAPR
ncbi:hypothetical protein [Streptomyces pilosus]|uniref:hypothetical protein n=1 Tax=Streptomyces pilosus TaxID=28893 RepID=UPI001678C605|nr:hypothetical protein [Streptomyces pilosus]